MDVTEFVKYFEFASLTTSLIYLKKYKATFYTFFVGYIIFAILADILGAIFHYDGNAWVYNIYTFFEFGSIMGFYYFLNKSDQTKKIIIVLSLIFYSIYCMGFKIVVVQNYLPILIPFFIMPSIFLYLKELLNSNKIRNYKELLPFWITVAFLIFYLGTLPFYCLLYIGGIKNRILFIVPGVILIGIHLIFMGSLIWSKPIQK